MNTKIKIAILAISALALQVATWFFLHRALISHPTPAEWAIVSVLASCAISVTTFFLLVDRSRLLADGVIAASAVAYILISPRNVFVLAGGIIFGLFGFWYEERLRRETQSRVDFAVTRVIGGSVSILIYGILLLLGFNLYYNVSTDFKNNPDKYYNRIAEQTTRSIVPYIAKGLPSGTNLNQPLADYFTNQAKQDPDFNKVGSFSRQVLINQAKQAFQEEFQITVSDNQTLGDVLGQVAVAKIEQAMAPFEKYLPLVFTLIIMGILYTFTFLLRWFILLISWVLFKIFKATGFFKLQKIQVEVEKLIV